MEDCMRRTFTKFDETTPDRVEGVYDDGMYHLVWARRIQGTFVASIDNMGWFQCLCDKHVPGPLVLVKTATCLECLVAYSG